MENIVDLKKKIRSVLISSKHGVRKNKFLNEYKQLTGEDIDVRKIGFTSLGDFLGSIPDTVVSNKEYYFAVTCDATVHMEKLIQQQKSNCKQKTKENFSRRQKPGQYDIQNDKRRFNKTRQDRFSRYNDDNRITRSVSMRDVGPELTVLPSSSSSTRLYQKHASQKGKRNHKLYTSVPATTDGPAIHDLRTKQSQRYVSTPDLHNKCVNNSGLDKRSYRNFRMSEQDLSESLPYSNRDCHRKKDLSTWQVDSCNNKCPNDNVVVADRAAEGRTVTLVDERVPGSRLKIHNGNIALQELRISFINTHLDDT